MLYNKNIKTNLREAMNNNILISKLYEVLFTIMLKMNNDKIKLIILYVSLQLYALHNQTFCR